MSVHIRSVFLALSSILVVSCGDSDPTAPVGSISIVTGSLAEAIEGQGYSQQLTATGGTGGYSWVLAAGSLPVGMTLVPGGTIFGMPVGSGTASFRVRATDAGGATATADFSITVIQALAVHTVNLPDAVVGEEYVAQLQAVGGRGAHAWSVSGGSAASWLSVTSGGALSGTATASGAFTVQVTVGDESGQMAAREFPIVVLEPVAVAAISLPTATQGRVYAAQLVATGGDGLYDWAVDGGELPTGMELARAGALTGTPEEAGAFTFVVRVTDGADRTATRSLTLTVVRAPTIRTSVLPPGEIGVAYAAALEATGGTGAYTWSVTSGTLPDDLSLSADGRISGTPTALGSASISVQVTDEASASHARAFTIVVADIQALTSEVAVTGIAGDAESVRYYWIEVPEGSSLLTVSVSGGTGDVDLYLRHGALPGEYTYDCRPLRQGNEETCARTSPDAGGWYVMLRGFAAYTDVRLIATHEP